MKELEVKLNENEHVSVAHHESSSDKWIFFCHGFGSNKDGSYKDRCAYAVENKWNAVRFDFRGNGKSSGDFINQNLSSKIKDLEAVIDYFNPDNCVVYGSSFGGKVALHSAISDNRIKGLVLRAPVTYNNIMNKYRAAVENKGVFEHISGKPIDKSFFEDYDNYSFEDVTEKLDIPVFIFHGGDDTTVHFENSLKALKNLKKSNIAVQKFFGENHRFSEKAEDKMRFLMFNWLEKMF